MIVATTQIGIGIAIGIEKKWDLDMQTKMFTDLRSMVIGAIENWKNREHSIALM
jgi:hypothetical protein